MDELMRKIEYVDIAAGNWFGRISDVDTVIEMYNLTNSKAACVELQSILKDKEELTGDEFISEIVNLMFEYKMIPGYEKG